MTDCDYVSFFIKCLLQNVDHRDSTTLNFVTITGVKVFDYIEEEPMV